VNLLGQIILVCLVIMAIQGLVAVLTVAIALSLLWGLFFRTGQTLGLIASFVLITALQVHPWATIGAFVALTAVVWIARTRAPEPPPLALPPPDEAPE
jgi:hypothetical protein